MKFLQNMKKKKANNKGFSLVELIIVIAIMAILVGVVGSQVVPYLEKSRKSKDIQILSGWCTDAMGAYSSSAAKLNPSAEYVITIKKGSVATAGDTATQDVLTTAFCELSSLEKGTGFDFATKMESKAGRAIDSVVITCTDPAVSGHKKNIITVEVKMKSGTDTTKLTFDAITSN